MFYQTFSINQNLYYPRLHLPGNDEGSVILAGDSGQLAFRKLFSDFRTSFVVISYLPYGLIVLFLHKRKADSLYDKL